MKGVVVGSVLTRSENFDGCAEVRARGRQIDESIAVDGNLSVIFVGCVVVRELGRLTGESHAGGSDSGRNATGGEEVGIITRVSSLDRCQNSMHGLVM